MSGPPSFLDECEKTAILVDGVSNHTLTRLLGWTIDYGRLRSYFERYTHLQKALYFTPMDEEDSDSLSRLLDWLSLNCWQVVTVDYSSEEQRQMPPSFRSDDRERIRKPGIDVEYTVNAMNLAYAGIEHFVFFT